MAEQVADSGTSNEAITIEFYQPRDASNSTRRRSQNEKRTRKTTQNAKSTNQNPNGEVTFGVGQNRTEVEEVTWLIRELKNTIIA